MVKKTATALALTLALCVPFVADAAAPMIPPKSGSTFEGATAQHRKLSLRIQGKSIQIVAFKFNCGPGVTGDTSAQSIPLKKGKYGYKFDPITVNGIVTYSDVTDENAKTTISGKFNRIGRRVTGALRVKSPRCGDSGSRKWYANRK